MEMYSTLLLYWTDFVEAPQAGRNVLYHQFDFTFHPWLSVAPAFAIHNVNYFFLSDANSLVGVYFPNAWCCRAATIIFQVSEHQAV
jgi:hypothetical protein